MKLHYIYELRSKEAGKLYIGRTCDWKQRAWDHFSKLRKNAHYNGRLQEIWNSFQDLEFFLIEGPIEDKQMAKDCEDAYIEKAMLDGTCVNVGLRNNNIANHPDRETILSSLYRGKQTGNGHLKPLVADGKDYPSIRAAARGLGVDPVTIRYRCKSSLAIYANYYYV